MPKPKGDKQRAVGRMVEGAAARLAAARAAGARLYATGGPRLGAFAVDQPESYAQEAAGHLEDYLEPHELADRPHDREDAGGS